MNTLTRYFSIIALLCGGYMLYDYSSKNVPKFKKDQCAKDSIQENTRKVTLVREWVYNYCLIRDNKCSKKQYSMRIKDFDRIMKSVKCPEAL